MNKTYMYNPTLRLGAIKTIEGYEKVVDLKELISIAEKASDAEFKKFVDDAIYYDILENEVEDEEECDILSEPMVKQQIEKIVEDLLRNEKFRKDVGLDEN